MDDAYGLERRAAAVATLAALAATLGDLGLLWVANAPRPSLGLPPPPPGCLTLGYYLGVLGIPLYALGYWAAARGLDGAAATPGLALARPASRAVCALGVVGAALGAVVHGMTAVVLAGGGRAVDGDPWAPFQPYAALLGPLWLALGAALLVGSATWARALLRGDTAFPRWMAATAPAVLMLATGLLAPLGPRVEAFLLPAGPNVVHAAFFVAVAATLGRAR